MAVSRQQKVQKSPPKPTGFGNGWRKESRTATPGSLVSLPEGVLLYTALAVYRQATGASDARGVQALYGAVPEDVGSTGSPNVMGYNASFAAAQMFGGALSAEEVLLRHSIVRYYANALAVVQRPAVIDYFERGGKLAVEVLPRDLKQSHASRAGLKYCCICADLDNSGVGFACWHTLHQLPFITHCERHDVALAFECSRCGLPFDKGQRGRLPGQSCTHCGARAPAPGRVKIGLGNRALIVSARHVELGELDGAVPPLWPVVVDDAILKLGGWMAAVRECQTAIEDSWKQGLANGLVISKEVGLPADFLVRELSLLSPICGVGRLVVYGALSQLLDLPRIVTAAKRRVEKGWSNDEDRTLRGLETTAVTLGVPPGVVRQIASMVPTDEIGGRMRIPRSAIYSLVRWAGLDSWGDLPTSRAEWAPNPTPASKGGFQGRVPRPDWHRSRVLEWKRQDPSVTQSKLQGTASVRWLQRHDPKWLSEVLPAARAVSRFSTRTEQRDAYRAVVLGMVERAPDISRQTVRQKYAGQWLTRHDKQWLSELLPTKHRVYAKGFQTRRAMHRQSVLDELRSDPGTTRSEVRRAQAAPCKWLYENDRVWLDKHLPVDRSRARKRSSAK